MYTPGPWHVGERYGENLPIVDDAGNLVALADCADKSNHADRVAEDAALIAAAPSMEMAFKAILKMCINNRLPADERCAVIFETAAEALARAAGHR